MIKTHVGTVDSWLVYQALKAHGHSPFKALEIVKDAERGDEQALRWIAIIREKRDG